MLLPDITTFEALRIRPPTDGLEAEDILRWQSSALRRRVIDGMWKQELYSHMRDQVGITRRHMMGPLSLTWNVLRDVSRELAVLYDTTPIVSHERRATPYLAKLVEQSGLWTAMQSHQMYTIGCIDTFMHVHVSERGRLVYRPVYSDLVTAEGTMDSPGVPIRLAEYRRRKLALEPGEKPKWQWTVDRYDISDPDNPVMRVELAGAKHLGQARDITAEVLKSGDDVDAYPWRMRDGRPFIPYIRYSESGRVDRMFDPSAHWDLVDGTFDAAVLYQGFLHEQRDASWPQKWSINLDIIGGTLTKTDGGGNILEVVSDPSTILEFRTPREITENELKSGTQMVGQFKAGADPEKTLANVQRLTDELANKMGISPDDIQRLGATARSGSAIALTNEGKRKAQGKYAQVFRPADQRLMAYSAALLNRRTGTNFIEGGYDVRYREIPLSPEERRARKDEAEFQLDRGLASNVDALRIVHPEMSEMEAEAQIARASGTAVVERELGRADGDLASAMDLIEDVMRLLERKVEQADVDAEMMHDALEDAMALITGADRVERDDPAEPAVVPGEE